MYSIFITCNNYNNQLYFFKGSGLTVSNFLVVTCRGLLPMIFSDQGILRRFAPENDSADHEILHSPDCVGIDQNDSVPQRCHPESRFSVTKDPLTVYSHGILRRFGPQNDSVEP
jgi:hypothetical protein